MRDRLNTQNTIKYPNCRHAKAFKNMSCSCSLNFLQSWLPCSQHMFIFFFLSDYCDQLFEILFNSVICTPAAREENLTAVNVPPSLCSKFERPDKAEAVQRLQKRFHPKDSWSQLMTRNRTYVGLWSMTEPCNVSRCEWWWTTVGKEDFMFVMHTVCLCVCCDRSYLCRMSMDSDFVKLTLL